MTPTPFRWVMRGAITRIRHVPAVPPRLATGAVAHVYAAAEREFGLLPPPLALHSPDPTLLAAAWLLLRETLLVTGSVDRATKEAVAAAVSLRNACPYCVEVHSAVLGGVHGRTDAAALAADRIDGVRDPGLRAVATWARGGGLDTPPPVPAGQRPELLGVCLAFDHLNRMVQVFLGSSPLPPALPAAGERMAGALLGRVLRPTAVRGAEPGVDLDLLPPAELPGELSWAAGSPRLAQALARVCAAVEAAGGLVLSPDARAAVGAAIAAHGGRPPDLTADLTSGVLSGPATREQAVARLALFVALAPHRVDDRMVDAFRAVRPAPGDLVAAASWGAFTAARVAAAARARTAVGEKTTALPPAQH